MNIKSLSPTFSVSPQIHSNDIAAIVDQGFRSIVCNRPDNEFSGLPTFDEIKSTATSCGLEVAFIPVNPRNISDLNIAEFKAAIQDLPKPILGFCGTGSRTQKLWILSQI